MRLGRAGSRLHEMKSLSRCLSKVAVDAIDLQIQHLDRKNRRFFQFLREVSSPRAC